jgi:hypothetical protein
MRAAPFLVTAAALAAALSCSSVQPTQDTYFVRTIGPILQSSCVSTNTGALCHTSDSKGDAPGRLDLSSFAGINKRRDLLVAYGAYEQPALLVKNVPPTAVAVESFDGVNVTVQTDIKHVGGQVLDPTASAYTVLRRWLGNGATENNTGPGLPAQPVFPCPHDLPAGFDPNSVDVSGADYQLFQTTVNPIIGQTCAAGNCHGTQTNDLYLTCGDSDALSRYNYSIATDYWAQNPEQAEIVRRPLAGAGYHEGGGIFASVNDPGYQAFFNWVKAYAGPQPQDTDPNFLFFAHRIQPLLVKKGCAMIQCHSGSMFHDYRLRGGSAGSFSHHVTRHNYDFTLAQLAIESPDVNASRLVQKNLFATGEDGQSTGLTEHRGAALFEDFKGVSPLGNCTPTACAICDTLKAGGPPDYDNDPIDTIPAYCMVREWLKRERSARNPAPLSGIVYVKRTPPAPGPDRPQDFDVFAGGAELHLVGATLNATGDVTLGGSDTVIHTACGLPAQCDIKKPAVSWDGSLVAFAARANANDVLQIYEYDLGKKTCTKSALNDGSFNFDPVYSPPDATGNVHLVFASTRGNLDGSNYDYQGPQRTPADPSKPNANLYVYEPYANPTVRQLTFQLNLERYPTFMADGRIIFVAEKRMPNFYELALRRINVDGGDYHPLYSQRATIGYTQAMYPFELTDKDFATIFSDRGAPHAGGALAVFNRSIGVDFTSTNAPDYLIDQSVAPPGGPNQPDPAFFIHSLHLVDPSAPGRLGQPTTGVYTSPAPLPSTKFLVSFGAAADPQTFDGNYDIYQFDPIAGTKKLLIGTAAAELEAVAVYGRPVRTFFVSRTDEPNGNTTCTAAGNPNRCAVPGGPNTSDITVLDFPVLSSLLFQNTPTGRAVDPGLTTFDIYEDLPPDPGTTSVSCTPAATPAACGPNCWCDQYGAMYVRRRSLGNVPLASDGSAHVVIPGGLPIILHLPDTSLSGKNGWPRWQREEMTFAPGEVVHQSFRGALFNGLCGQCHGSISGQSVDIGLVPDMITQASQTLSHDAPATQLDLPPGSRGQPEGPPANP